MRDIGKNIKDLRIRKNMTQDGLAEQLFVTRQTVSNYETGKSRPDIDMLMKIAEVLDTDIHHLLYGTQTPVERENIRRLVVGSILTALIGAIWLFTAPHLMELRGRYLIAGPAFLQHFFLFPLFFLLLGWTAAQVIGMALRKEPLKKPWTVYVRYCLLLILTFYFFLMLSYLVPFLIGEYRFIHGTGDRSLSDFLCIPAYAEFLFGELLFPYFFTKLGSGACAFTLPLGGLLWLFGFPKMRLSDKNN